MRKQLHLSQAHLAEMRAHVDSCLPNEGCGLLAGKGAIVQWVLPVTNREQSPIRFRMDAREQLRSFRSIEEAGLELVGIFHSHPAEVGIQANPMDEPSATDVQEAAYPVVQLILFRQQGRWSERGFWIENGRVSAVPMQIAAEE